MWGAKSHKRSKKSKKRNHKKKSVMSRFKAY